MKNNKEFRLPKKFAEKWLQALRSGKYNQAIGKLYDDVDNGFCCLGLACKLKYPLHYLKSHIGNFAHVIHKGKNYDVLKYDLKKIPKELKGTAHVNLLVKTLASKNDSGSSFKEIADWIENNIELYD